MTKLADPPIATLPDLYPSSPLNPSSWDSQTLFSPDSKNSFYLGTFPEQNDKNTTIEERADFEDLNNNSSLVSAFEPDCIAPNPGFYVPALSLTDQTLINQDFAQDDLLESNLDFAPTSLQTMQFRHITSALCVNFVNLISEETKLQIRQIAPGLLISRDLQSSLVISTFDEDVTGSNEAILDGYDALCDAVESELESNPEVFKFNFNSVHLDWHKITIHGFAVSPDYNKALKNLRDVSHSQYFNGESMANFDSTIETCFSSKVNLTLLNLPENFDRGLAEQIVRLLKSKLVADRAVSASSVTVGSAHYDEFGKIDGASGNYLKVCQEYMPAV